MQTIHDYIDKAVINAGLKSDRDLCRHLGISVGAASHWRTGRTWPSDETMMQLANIADQDEAEALLLLNFWRAKGAAKAQYSAILDAIRARA